MNKVAIIGCGNVGMSYAFALTVQVNKVNELVLIDINRDKAEGEAMDLNHALTYSPNQLKIYAGDYSDLDDANILVIAAGKNQEVGETRSDLIFKNYDVFDNIISQIKKTKFDGIILIATNPLDVMSYVTYKLSGFPHERVIGSGTTLDTARLRHLVGQKLKINPKNVHAYVIGEHGDSEFVAWSTAMIGVGKLTNELSANSRSRISYDVKNSAYDIINKKGNTSYGIGMCLLALTNAILDNSHAIFTVSCYDPKKKIYYGNPAVIGAKGVESRQKLDLPHDEKILLDESIYSIEGEINKLKLK